MGERNLSTKERHRVNMMNECREDLFGGREGLFGRREGLFGGREGLFGGREGLYGGREGLVPIQIRRSDILQSYWFSVRPLGPHFLRYATNTQLSQFSVQFMVFIFGHIKEERPF